MTTDIKDWDYAEIPFSFVPEEVYDYLSSLNLVDILDYYITYIKRLDGGYHWTTRIYFRESDNAILFRLKFS